MNTFEDLLPGEYYYDAVIWAKEKGIVNGINEFCFDANEEMTREQFVAILYRYAHQVQYSSSKFPD